MFIVVYSVVHWGQNPSISGQNRSYIAVDGSLTWLIAVATMAMSPRVGSVPLWCPVWSEASGLV